MILEQCDTIRNNVATMLERPVALKNVVANRLQSCNITLTSKELILNSVGSSPQRIIIIIIFILLFFFFEKITNNLLSMWEGGGESPTPSDSASAVASYRIYTV